MTEHTPGVTPGLSGVWLVYCVECTHQNQAWVNHDGRDGWPPFRLRQETLSDVVRSVTYQRADA